MSHEKGHGGKTELLKGKNRGNAGRVVKEPRSKIGSRAQVSGKIMKRKVSMEKNRVMHQISRVHTQSLEANDPVLLVERNVVPDSRSLKRGEGTKESGRDGTINSIKVTLWHRP